jgi:hypothetical protein
MSISAASGPVAAPDNAATQKADLARLAGQYAARKADGTAEATAKSLAGAIGSGVQSIPGHAIGHVTLASATAEVNHVLTTAQNAAGLAPANGATPLFNTPYTVADRKQDVQAAAGAYHQLVNSNNGEAAARAIGESASNTLGGNFSLSSGTAAVNQTIRQAALNVTY